MKIHRNRTRGRAREGPFARIFLIVAVGLLAAAAFDWTDGSDRWTVARTVVAAVYAAYAFWFFLRARRRDRAADAAGPPRE